MNRILVTGMALGAEPEINTCDSCNFDIEWLAQNPSTLLWADKIILTPKMMETIERRPESEEEKKYDDGIKVIFENLKLHDLIEVKNPASVITPKIIENIYSEIRADSKNLCRLFPAAIQEGAEGVPGSLMVEDVDYCDPVLWTMYAGLLLANKWGANILYQERAYRFLKYKFGLNIPSFTSFEKQKAFTRVFSAFLPASTFIPHVWADPKCKSCVKVNECDSKAIKEIEKKVKKVLEWRQYDELYELRQVITDLSNKKDEAEEGVSADEIIKDFEAVEQHLKRKIHKVFPKVERWCNMVTVLSVPTALAGVTTGSPKLAAIGAGVGGIATVTSKYIEIMKSKYRWLGFRTEALRKQESG